MDDATREEIKALQNLCRENEQALANNPVYILQHEEHGTVTFFTDSNKRTPDPTKAKRYT